MSTKYVIKVKFCFDRNWLYGFAFGTGIKRAEIIKRVRTALEEACDGESDCKFKIVHDQSTELAGLDWTSWVEHPDLEAPLGCQVRRLGQVAKVTMKKTMEGMVNCG